MHQNHEPGEKMFVDFAGDTIPVIIITTGETRMAQIFIAVLGYSNYSYAEAMWKQDTQVTTNAVVNSLEYFQGSPKTIVPDNMKTAVSKP
ncbi:Integrase, catalytic core domain protein, partial [mine drainage metagenome]